MIIIDIRDLYDPFWGDTVLVIANKEEKIGGFITIFPEINDSSSYFQFRDGDIIKNIMEIAKQKQIWTPSDDFSENYKPIGIGGKSVLVYEHVALYDITSFDKSGNGGYKAIIKNKEAKIQRIVQDYKIDNLGEDDIVSFFERKLDGKMFAYLFDSPYLEEVKPQDIILFGQRNDAIELFKESLEELEEQEL